MKTVVFKWPFLFNYTNTHDYKSIDVANRVISNFLNRWLQKQKKAVAIFQ